MLFFAGIGIDDMFVIVQCLTNLRSEAEAGKWRLDRRMGEALKHAGVSITVTSATDVVAFGVGATRQCPASVQLVRCRVRAFLNALAVRLTSL